MRPVLVVCALGAIGAAACLSTPPENSGPSDSGVDSTDAPEGCRDEDGDGWSTGCAGIPAEELDCNDGQPAGHPGALEQVDADDDHDCDGVDGITMPQHFPDLTVSPFGTGTRITTRFGRYDLDPAHGHQLASVAAYGMDGQLSPELLFQGVSQLREMFSGVHVWDDYLAVAPDESNLAGSSPLIAGPVVYQAIVHYGAGGTPGDRALDGDSLYTFTIDGRIIRTDHLELNDQAIFVSGGGDFPGITSHVALAAQAADTSITFDNIAVLDGTSRTTDDLPDTGPNEFHFSGMPNTMWRWLCAYGPQVEVGWAASVPVNGQLRRGLRATSNLNPPMYRQVALQYDWQVGVAPEGTLTLGEHVGHFLIVPHARSMPEPCDLFDRQARGYLTPADVDFGNPSTGSLYTEGLHDDNDDGYDEAGGYWALQAAGPAGIAFSMVRPAGTEIPPHSLFRIAGVPDDVEPLVLIGGNRQTQGQHYRIQQDGTTGIWLAVLRGLQPGEVVELRYPRTCAQYCPSS